MVNNEEVSLTIDVIVPYKVQYRVYLEPNHTEAALMELISTLKIDFNTVLAPEQRPTMSTLENTLVRAINKHPQFYPDRQGAPSSDIAAPSINGISTVTISLNRRGPQIPGSGTKEPIWNNSNTISNDIIEDFFEEVREVRFEGFSQLVAKKIRL